MSVYSNMALAVVAEQGRGKNISAAQFLYEADRLDLNVFNAVLESDFAEVMEKHGLIALTEADKEEGEKIAGKGLAAAIRNIFDRIVKFITEKFIAFKKVISDLVDKDKRIWAKYGNLITADSIKGCQEKGEKVTDYAEVMVGLQDTINEIKNNYKKDADEVLNANDVETALATAKENVKKIEDKIASKEFAENMFDTSDALLVEKLKGTALNDLKDNINGGYKKALKTYDDLAKDLKNMIKNDTKLSKEIEDKTVSNAAKEVATLYSRLIAKFTAVQFAILKDSIKADRANFITLGNYVVKSNGGSKKVDVEEVKEESYILTEISNMLVEEAFEAEE